MRSATFAGGVRILSVVGNRPQFVKSAPLSLALREAGIREVVLHTGQHYDREMSQVFFDELGIPAPAHNLAVGSGPQGAQTGRMLERIEDAFERHFVFVGVTARFGRESCLLTGSAEVKESPEQSAVLAVLDATNRYLARLVLIPA